MALQLLAEGPLKAGDAFDQRCIAVTAVAAISSGERFVDFKAEAQSPWAPCANQVKNCHGASLCLAAAEACRVLNNEQQGDMSPRCSHATEATTSNKTVAITATTDSTTTSASATG